MKPLSLLVCSYVPTCSYLLVCVYVCAHREFGAIGGNMAWLVGTFCKWHLDQWVASFLLCVGGGNGVGTGSGGRNALGPSRLDRLAGSLIASCVKRLGMERTKLNELNRWN